jgi:hypothetical protein
MTAACSMSAVRRRRPPHRGHAGTSNSKVRRMSSAHRCPRGSLAEVVTAIDGVWRHRRSGAHDRLNYDFPTCTE